jgi:hypothetical protein
MIPRVPLREALSDPNMLGTAIAGDSWRSWRTLLIAAMGEELHKDEREIFTKLAGREREPLQRVDEFAAVIGRRGGKSRAMATLATYIAGLCDHSDALVPGERGVLLCVALDQRVAKIILDAARVVSDAGCTAIDHANDACDHGAHRGMRKPTIGLQASERIADANAGPVAPEVGKSSPTSRRRDKQERGGGGCQCA